MQSVCELMIAHWTPQNILLCLLTPLHTTPAHCMLHVLKQALKPGMEVLIFHKAALSWTC